MAYFNLGVQVMQTLVTAIGAGIGVWGAIKLLEAYSIDNL